MILDNETRKPKVFDFIKNETNNGKRSLLTGYFTIYKILEYKPVLSDIVINQ